MKRTVSMLIGFVACSHAWSATATPPLDCMIQPMDIVQIGSPTVGVIERLLAERGDLVNQGQVVAQLQADVERASLALARERAAQAGELAAARSSHAFAQRELGRANELYEKNFVSHTYLDKQRTEVQVAEGRTDQVREKRTTATKEVDLAIAQLNMRTIRAPIAGVVVDRFASVGERIDDKPLMRIARINPLRVDVLVPAAAFGQVKTGQKAIVIPELLDRQERTATVKTVDRVIDAASSTFRVRLELPNPDAKLPAGLRCKVDLGLTMPEKPAPATGAPAAPSTGPASLSMRAVPLN
ncbi:MAG: efflux RND transporter periplasmic adaptor subunit [Burkholderiales bacterium]